jgi:CheY-specific phosphatase CheX
MSSHMLPPPLESDPFASPIAAAVGTVAERSFYAVVDQCDADESGSQVPEWLVATVYFDNGLVAGSLACSLPSTLAQSLFDAFTGRDPASPLPRPEQLTDLVGEFSNMVCGDWLSRHIDDRVFHLSPPLVARAAGPAHRVSSRQWLKLNEQPLAVDWHVSLIAATATAGEGA